MCWLCMMKKKKKRRSTLSFHNIAYPGKSSGFPASISILRLAVIELYYLKKDSYKICINEAVELAKSILRKNLPAL